MVNLYAINRTTVIHSGFPLNASVCSPKELANCSTKKHPNIFSYSKTYASINLYKVHLHKSEITNLFLCYTAIVCV